MSSSHTTVFPKGDAKGRTQPFGDDEVIGAVDVGEVTIQSADPGDLDQLATTLAATASRMRRERANARVRAGAVPA